MSSLMPSTSSRTDASSNPSRPVDFRPSLSFPIPTTPAPTIMPGQLRTFFAFGRRSRRTDAGTRSKLGGGTSAGLSPPLDRLLLLPVERLAEIVHLRDARPSGSPAPAPHPGEPLLIFISPNVRIIGAAASTSGSCSISAMISS